MNLRAANYFMKHVDKNDGSHTYCYVDHKGDEHQPFRTLNYLTVIDEDSIQDTFRAANVTQMIVPQVPYPHNIGGYEDVRLLWNDEDKTMWITFTSLVTGCFIYAFISLFFNSSFLLGTEQGTYDSHLCGAFGR